MRSQSINTDILIFAVLAVIFGGAVSLVRVVMDPADMPMVNMVGAALILLFTLYIRLHELSWLSPGVFFALLWSMAMVMSIVLAPDYELHPEGLVWILISLIVVYTGSRFGVKFDQRLWGDQDAGYETDKREQLRKSLAWGIVACMLIGMVGISILLASIGKNLFDLIAFDEVKAMGKEFARLRYTVEGYREPWMYSILMTALPLSALLAGVLFVISPDWKFRLIALLPIVLALINAAAKTNRGTILFTSSLWVAAYLAALLWREGRGAKLFDGRRVTAMSGLFASFLVLYVVLQMSREGQFSAEFLGDALTTFKSAAFGSFFAFSHWMSVVWGQFPEPSWGEYSSRIPAMLGLAHERFPGLFGDVHYLGDTYRDSTTIYTVFRAFIQDFTVWGALILLYIAGFVGGLAHRRVLAGDLRFLPILATFYAFTTLGYLMSVFLYNSLLLGLFLFYLFFVVWSWRWTRTPS